jgi:hypothetical protein
VFAAPLEVTVSPPSTDVASLTAVNIALNSVVSDDAFFGTADLTDFYLGTPVTLPLSQRQFIRIDMDSYSPAVLARLSLLPFIRSARNGKRFVILFPHRSDHVWSESCG